MTTDIQLSLSHSRTSVPRYLSKCTYHWVLYLHEQNNGCHTWRHTTLAHVCGVVRVCKSLVYYVCGLFLFFFLLVLIVEFECPFPYLSPLFYLSPMNLLWRNDIFANLMLDHPIIQKKVFSNIISINGLLGFWWYLSK